MRKKNQIKCRSKIHLDISQQKIILKEQNQITKKMKFKKNQERREAQNRIEVKLGMKKLNKKIEERINNQK